MPRSHLGTSLSQRYTIHAPTQGVAGNGVALAQLLKVPRDKVRLLTANVGGSFGMKNIHYPEYRLYPARREVAQSPREVD